MDNLDTVNVPGVPNRPKDFIPKSQYEKIVDDFLTKIVIHAEDLVFPPIGIQGSLQFSRTLKIVTEGFLNLKHKFQSSVPDIGYHL